MVFFIYYVYVKARINGEINVNFLAKSKNEKKAEWVCDELVGSETTMRIADDEYPIYGFIYIPDRTPKIGDVKESSDQILNRIKRQNAKFDKISGDEL